DVAVAVDPQAMRRFDQVVSPCADELAVPIETENRRFRAVKEIHLVAPIDRHRRTGAYRDAGRHLQEIRYGHEFNFFGAQSEAGGQGDQAGDGRNPGVNFAHSATSLDGAAIRNPYLKISCAAAELQIGKIISTPIDRNL